MTADRPATDPPAAPDNDPWAAWRGRQTLLTETLHPAPLRGWCALLDREPPAARAELPPLAHWVYALDASPQSALGPDGHAQRGRFLPPVELPRRMWAGGRLCFLQPLHLGDAVLRESTVARIESKRGRSGELVFVTVRHVWRTQGQADAALTEEHDIVYREAPRAGASAAAAPGGRDETLPPADFHRVVRPDPVLLFRYSALTFNGHRIHYDQPYATGVEGYPGLVVHGPLIATWLLDLLQRQVPGARVRRFDFTAHRPVFDTAPFELAGRWTAAPTQAELWCLDNGGALAMRATATLE